MTLVLNEIHILDSLDDTFIIAAADRRIKGRDGKNKSWKKLFEIPYLHGAISYYGLAEFIPNGKSEYVNFPTFLTSFIRNNSDVDNLETFSFRLKKELNRVVPSTFLRKYSSGFHICGYDDNGYPDFWHISNVGELSEFKYLNPKDNYQDPANDLRKSNLPEVDWSGNNPMSVKNRHIVYRNGDFRAHGVVFDFVDAIYSYLSKFDIFIRIDAREQYRDYVKIKFEILAYLYKKLTKTKAIGGPIDVLLIQKS